MPLSRSIGHILAIVALELAIGVHAQAIYENGVTVTTLAGKSAAPGDRDGPAADALFKGLRGIATVGDDVFVISDADNRWKLKRIRGGSVQTIYEFSSSVYNRLIGDPWRSSMVVVFHSEAVRLSVEGAVIGTLAFPPFAKIGGNLAGEPRGQSLYLLDLSTGNSSYLAGNTSSAFRDGKGAEASFQQILGTVVGEQVLYVADGGRLRTVTFDGSVSTLGSDGYADGGLSNAKLSVAAPLAMDQDGNVVFVQFSSGTFGPHCIRRLARNEVKTLAGRQGFVGGFDGDGFNARFTQIADICVDHRNRLLVADQHSVRVVTFPESRRDRPATMGIRVVPGITVSGEVGAVYRIEFQESVGTPWQLLMPIVLTKPTQEYFDYDAAGRSRVYRVVLP